MNEIKESKYASNKILGVVTLIVAVFGFLIVIHRLSYYVFEYDAEFSPIDYGKYNILSFFTVQSNIFAYFYLLITSFALFGVKRAKKIAFNPTLGALVTTYIIIAGLVYCVGIPLGFTPPFKWDTAAHSMSSFIQVYYHMLMPPFMLVLWLFPMSNEKIPGKNIWLAGIYPLAYSIFSIVRGAFSQPQFYPYPFYRPDFIWDIFVKNSPVNMFKAYLLMLPVLVAGIMLFIGAAKLTALLHNKRIGGVK